MWACMHMPICTFCNIKAEGSGRSVSEVVETPHWKIHCLYTHTDISDREAPHMAFSSEAVASCSMLQWALPLIVTTRHSLYHSPYFGRGCAGHFSILITGRHLPLSLDTHLPPPKYGNQHWRCQSRVALSIGWPPSFEFRNRLMFLHFLKWTLQLSK